MAYDESSTFSALAALKPAVRLTLPPLWFFKFPPSSTPQTLPPPPDHPTLAHPFTIPLDTYNNLLDGRVPFTIALVYITTVTWLNSVNASRGYKPWAFSKTSFFKSLVIIHNILLATYSAWTCIGMVNALNISFYSPRDAFGVAGTVDSLCKINGPRGMGSAAVFTEKTSAWGIANRFFHLGADGLTPEATDVGRIWNEGLAFYGWLFYISKFYEVIDTLIIIAKGKKSSFLQTYHHAGAMICMWAGIRYMSPPIWMFVLVNSFIHTIMYTFYLCSATGVRVPVWFKRTLTTLQITQFVVGALYAFVHLFVEYQGPVSVPYIYHLGSVASAVASDASSAASTATATVSANLGAQLKKLALRAAGREGLAENVLNDRGEKFGIDAVKAAQDFVAREETRFRDELQWTHCLDTSGQAFAIYLNVLYLAPLTWLFVRFFIRSYLQRLERRRSSAGGPSGQHANLAVESYRDAKRDTGRRLSHAFENTQGEIDRVGDDFAVVDDEEFKEQLEDAASKTKEATISGLRTSRERIETATETTTRTVTNIKEEVKNTVSRTEEGMSRTLEDLKDDADSVKAQVESSPRHGLGIMQEFFENSEAKSSSFRGEQHEQRSMHESTDTSETSYNQERSSWTTDTRATSFGQSFSSAADTMNDALADALRSIGSVLKPDDGADNRKPSNDAEDEKQMEEGSSQHPVANIESDDREEHELATEKTVSNNTDDNVGQDADNSTSDGADQKAQDQTEQDKSSEPEELSSKEQVRKGDPDEGTQAEASTGVPEEAEDTADKSKTENVESEDITTSEEPNKEAISVEDPSLEDSKREDDGPEEHAAEESVTQTDSGEAEHSTDASVDKDSRQDSSSAMDDNAEGRQESFHKEREEALEKLQSINSQDVNTEKPHTTTYEQSEEPESSRDSEAFKEDSEEPKQSFDEARAEALKKLKSANSDATDRPQLSEDQHATSADGKPHESVADEAPSTAVEHSEQAPQEEDEKDTFGIFDDLEDDKKGEAAPKADNDSPVVHSSPDFGDQKESWIHVGDEVDVTVPKPGEESQSTEEEAKAPSADHAEESTAQASEAATHATEDKATEEADSTVEAGVSAQEEETKEDPPSEKLADNDSGQASGQTMTTEGVEPDAGTTAAVSEPTHEAQPSTDTTEEATPSNPDHDEEVITESESDTKVSSEDKDTTDQKPTDEAIETEDTVSGKGAAVEVRETEASQALDESPKQAESDSDHGLTSAPAEELETAVDSTDASFSKNQPEDANPESPSTSTTEDEIEAVGVSEASAKSAQSETTVESADDLDGSEKPTYAQVVTEAVEADEEQPSVHEEPGVDEQTSQEIATDGPTNVSLESGRDNDKDENEDEHIPQTEVSDVTTSQGDFQDNDEEEVERAESSIKLSSNTDETQGHVVEQDIEASSELDTKETVAESDGTQPEEVEQKTDSREDDEPPADDDSFVEITEDDAFGMHLMKWAHLKRHSSGQSTVERMVIEQPEHSGNRASIMNTSESTQAEPPEKRPMSPPQWFEMLNRGIDSRIEPGAAETSEKEEVAATSGLSNTIQEDDNPHKPEGQEQDHRNTAGSAGNIENKKEDLHINTEHEDPKEVTEAGA